MGLTVAELEDWETQFGASQIKSLDEVYTDHSLLFSDAARTVEDKMQQDEMRKMLRRALGQLPEREALVLQLYFVEELNVYEIAEILGVTTGRVSQIKKRPSAASVKASPRWKRNDHPKTGVISDPAAIPNLRNVVDQAKMGDGVASASSCRASASSTTRRTSRRPGGSRRPRGRSWSTESIATVWATCTRTCRSVTMR